MSYKLIERTPDELRCGPLFGCPAIFEKTPVEMRCGPVLGCPGIYENQDKSTYVIIGKQLTTEEIKELGLSAKVGKGESMIEVPKGLLAKL